MIAAAAAIAVVGLVLVLRLGLDLLAHVSRHRSYRRRYPRSGASFGAVWIASRDREIR